MYHSKSPNQKDRANRFKGYNVQNEKMLTKSRVSVLMKKKLKIDLKLKIKSSALLKREIFLILKLNQIL